MEILRRLEQQVEVVGALSEELRREASYRGVERLVQLTIQALLDLGLMVLSALGGSPSGYRDVAASLSRLNLLNREDAELMRKMAGLRNILVHAYVGTSRETVVESSKRLPGDAARLADEILSSARRIVDDPPTTMDSLVEGLRRTLKDRVRLAFLFGSQVRDYSLKGDVDIAVYFDRSPDPYEAGGILSDLQEALGREDIDLLVLDDCDNVALAHEAVQGKPILGDQGEILQLRTRIASLHMDYQFNLDKVRKMLKA